MQHCIDCSMAQWLGAQRRDVSAALALSSILVAASLVTSTQQSVRQGNTIE